MSLIIRKWVLGKEYREEEIKELFEHNNTMTIQEWEQRQKFICADDGAKFNLKEENGYIDIEYHNQVGAYKAKMLLQLFDKHQEFYQYFLARYRKIIIQNNRDRENINDIIIDNEPYSISVETILEQILNSSEHKYLSFLLVKLRDNKNLLTQEEALDLLKAKILDDAVKNKKIDFFKYLDLMEGKCINFGCYFQRAMIDKAFQYQNYSILERYMNSLKKEDFDMEIFKALHQEYGLILLNQTLEHQKQLSNRYQEQAIGNFLSKNLLPLNLLFRDHTFKIIKEYQNIKTTETKQVDLATILALVLEFLKKMDSTGRIALEFEENVSNGTIILWDPKDTDMRKIMQGKYFHYFCIDAPLCYSEYDQENNLTFSVVNIPLTYTLEDVMVIVHEFFHFYCNLDSKKIKNSILMEFPSIYFETKVLEFLKEKGYSIEEIPVNFRVLDSFTNFLEISPMIIYFSEYMNKGEISLDFLSEIIKKVQDECLKICHQSNFNEEETRNELLKYGIYDHMEDSLIQLIYNLNHLLLRHDEIIYKASPYLFGTILARCAIDHGVSSREIIDISNRLNEIEDPCEVMKQVGIDLEQYHFQRENQEVQKGRNHL